MIKKTVQFGILLILLDCAISLAGTSGELRVGYPSRMFFDVDARDAQVAIELWSKQVTTHMGTPLESRTIFFDNLDSLVKMIKGGEIDVLTLFTLDYMKIKEKVDIEPFLVAVRNDQVGDEFLLLTHVDSRANSIEDLKDGDLIVETGRSSLPLGLLWLDTLLMKAELAKRSSYFNSIKETTKTSQAILPVFFQQADLCIVTRHSFETMAELNPQLHTNLIVLAHSPNLVRALYFAQKGMDSEIREVVEDGATQLQHHVEGQQILTLFKAERIIPFEPHYLDGVKDLLNEHKELLCRRAD